MQPLLLAVALAATGSPFADLRLLSADPDTPAMGMQWRGALRGTISAEIRAVEPDDRGGFDLRVVPLVELHNEPGSEEPLPNQNWRGVLGAEGGWSWVLDGVARKARIGLRVQHESDHFTGREGGGDNALQLNDISLRGSLVLASEASAVRLALTPRAYVFSCTDIQKRCLQFHDGSTFGLDAGVTFDAGGQSPDSGHWYLFASLHAAWILPHNEVIREQRTAVHAGVWMRGASGMWQLFALVFTGNDVGIGRGRSVTQVGAGMRWAY